MAWAFWASPVLPGYAQSGLCRRFSSSSRLLQGLSLGGEYGTSATYLSEVAIRTGGLLLVLPVRHSDKRPAPWALGVQSSCSSCWTPAQMHTWGWHCVRHRRAAAVTVMWLRRTMDESENFALAAQEADDEADSKHCSPIRGSA